MSNSRDFGDRTVARPGMGHRHTPRLIMHWIEVCADPKAHRVSGESTTAANPLTHRDQLAAVWIEPGAARPRPVS
jgi:hypothetical protein